MAEQRPPAEWLRFAALTRAYGARTIFSELDGTLREGTKVGLVGPNGAGKSSLVRILAGREEPDAGTVVRARDARPGYLEQNAASDAQTTLRALLASAFEHIHAEEARVRELEAELSAAAESGDNARSERALRAYGTARDRFDRHGGATLEGRMRSMLSAFGFDDDDLDRPTGEFSGGQRTRAALARLFLEEPDYLILDEPTNHLDLESVRWLEMFLRDDPRAALVVSHDRYFLDRVADEIWELEDGRLERYAVTRDRAYSEYVEAKAERLELARRAFENFRDEERRRNAVIAELRTHGSHNYAQVRSREKALAKLERVAAPRTGARPIGVSLEAARRATSGLALTVRGLSKAYAKPLFSTLSFELGRGVRLAVVGRNGSGKSTLLKILAERLPADRGDVKLAEGASVAYFAQDAADELPGGVSAAEAVLAGSTIAPQDARELLGRLGLSGEAGDKPVEAFSGGERRRIMLARLMARAADCLFLDEPTNDLDIPSREALESVLASYGGALVVVSHDRYLLRRIAERVLWLHDGSATLFEGDYERFEAQQREAPAEAAPKPAARTPSAAKREREARLQDERALRALASSEREVERLEAERERLQGAFADPALYADPARVGALQSELEAAEAALTSALERWEALMESTAKN
jgi:ATP-binding cassette subfamily F protein 3